MGKRDSGYVFVDHLQRPFDHYRLGAALARVCEHAGVRRIKWHALRHTFASQMAMYGTPLNIVQSLLGHASVTMTMRYAHVAPSALRSAIELANPRTADAASVGQPVGNRWQYSQRQQQFAEEPVAEKQATAPRIDRTDLPLAA